MKYSYQEAGTEKTRYVEAPDALTAIKIAPNRAPTSGVMLEQSTPDQNMRYDSGGNIGRTDTPTAYSTGDTSPAAMAWRADQIKRGLAVSESGMTKTTTGDNTPIRDIFDFEKYQADINSQKASLEKDKETRRLAMIDAITNKYTQKAKGIDELSKAEAARTRSLNLRSGTIGSNFGSSELNKVDKATKEALDANEAAKLEEIKAETAALDDLYYTRKRDVTSDKLGELKNIADIRKLETDEQVARRAPATTILKSFATKGVTYDQFKLDPSYENVKGDFSDDELKALFISNAPQASFLSDKPEIVGSDAVWFQRQADGSVKAVKVNIGATGDNIKDVVKTDNGIYVINKDGTFKNIGGGDGVDSVKGFTFNQDALGKLSTVGISANDAKAIEADLKSNSLDSVLAGIQDEKQKQAIKSLVSGTQGEFLTTDYFGKIMSEDQLKSAASEAGLRGVFSGWESEKKAYLDYLMDIVDQYRKAGKTDEEILKAMQ